MVYKYLKCFGGVEIYLILLIRKSSLSYVSAYRFILAACVPLVASRRLFRSPSKVNPVVIIKALFFWKKNWAKFKLEVITSLKHLVKTALFP